MAPERPNTAPTRPTAPGPRRLRPLLFVLLVVAPLTGCRSLFGDFALFKPRVPDLPVAPRANAGKEEIVEHLNENIRKLRGWRSSKVKISAEQPGMPSFGLSASIAVERPRNFRLRARSIFRGDEADFGSNDERFWLWMQESPQKVVFHARHENVHLVQARMHIPFDPDWLIESLGVVEIDPSQVSLERTDPTGVVVDLFEERILANGQRAKLATTVDTNRGVIVGRTLYDPRGGLVARATITEHRVHEPDGPDGGVVLPHEIRLEWPQARTTLVLDIGSIAVNPPPDDTAFAMPRRPDCPPHALDGGVTRQVGHERPAPFRTAEAPDRGFRFEDEIAGNEEEFDPSSFEDPRADRNVFDPGFERGDDRDFGAPVPGTMPVRGHVDDGPVIQPIGASTPIDIRPRESPVRRNDRWPAARSNVRSVDLESEFDPSEFDRSEFGGDEFDAADFSAPVRREPRPPAEAWYDE